MNQNSSIPTWRVRAQQSKKSGADKAVLRGGKIKGFAGRSGCQKSI